MKEILNVDFEQVHAEFGIVANRDDDKVSKHNKIPQPKHVADMADN